MEPTEPLVSCIMPTLDRRALVPRAIAGFLAQTYPARELVILDDGADPVEDVVPDDARIRYIRLPERLRVGAKRNAACAEARGSLIAHFDDDDWYHPERLARQVEVMRDPSVGLCGVPSLLYWDRVRRQAWRYRRSAGRAWLSMLCYRKEVWAAHRFPDQQQASDTHFLWSLPPALLRAMPDERLMVCTIHRHNVSPKLTVGRDWTPLATDHLVQILGDDWAWFADLDIPTTERAPAPTPTRARRPRSAARVADEPVPMSARPEAPPLLTPLRRALPDLEIGDGREPADIVFVDARHPFTAKRAPSVVWLDELLLDAAVRRAIEGATLVVAASAEVAAGLASFGPRTPDVVVSPGTTPCLERRAGLAPVFTVRVLGPATPIRDGYVAPDGAALAHGEVRGFDRVLALGERLPKGRLTWRFDATHRRAQDVVAGPLARAGHRVEIELDDLPAHDRCADIDILLAPGRTSSCPRLALDAVEAGAVLVASRASGLGAFTDHVFDEFEGALDLIEGVRADRDRALREAPRRRERVAGHDERAAVEALARAVSAILDERPTETQ